MKQLLVVGLLAFSFACSRNAQVENTAVLPDPIIGNFQGRYPEARNIEWELEDDIYEVRFIDEDGRVRYEYYDADRLLEDDLILPS